MLKSWVYFIVNENRGAVKIGKSLDPFKRCAMLQTGSCDQLKVRAVVPGDREEEDRLHRLYANFRQRGEWFALEGKLAEYVGTLPPASPEFPEPISELALDFMVPVHPDMVRDAVTRCGIAKAELARRAGCHANTLAAIEDEDWNPRWFTLRALCAAAEAIRAERA